MLKCISGLNSFLHLLVLIFVLLSFVNHPLYIVLGKSSLLICDGDIVMLASALVDGRNVHDAICIDIEGHFDLRYASRGWWDSFEVELAEQVVVFG
jgi:hypothetical protein